MFETKTIEWHFEGTLKNNEANCGRLRGKLSKWEKNAVQLSPNGIDTLWKTNGLGENPDQIVQNCTSSGNDYLSSFLFIKPNLISVEHAQEQHGVDSIHHLYEGLCHVTETIIQDFFDPQGLLCSYIIRTRKAAEKKYWFCSVVFKNIVWWNYQYAPPASPIPDQKRFFSEVHKRSDDITQEFLLPFLPSQR